MLGTLAPVKDVLQWIMVVIAAALIECARREYMRAEHVGRQQVQLLGAGVDFGGPSQGVNVDFQTKNIAGVELTQISGPKLVFRAEEEARRKKEEDAAKKSQQGEAAKKKQVQFAAGAGAEAGSLPSAPQPIGPGPSGNKDNYYSNGLKRSGTLNHMYESRVAGTDVAAATAGQSQRGPATRPQQQQESTAPPPPGKQDNYYGNGNGSAPGLKRSGTLNYMYESRV
jgi:hypothetical protein